MVKCKGSCWRYVWLRPFLLLLLSSVVDPDPNGSDPDPIPYRNRPIIPNKLYNFVNLYFKVVKFVFGFNYCSLENLKIALYTTVLLKSCDILYKFLPVHLHGLVLGSDPDPDPGQDQVWSDAWSGSRPGPNHSESTTLLHSVLPRLITNIKICSSLWKIT
jgi:hypothetical protein